jgi:hypothetical protein
MHRLIQRCRGSDNQRRGLLHPPLFTNSRSSSAIVQKNSCYSSATVHLSLIGHNWQKRARMDLQWKPFSHVFNLSCIYFSNSAEHGIYFLNSAERGLMALVLLKNPWVPMDISKTPSKFHGFDWISLNFHPNLVPRPLMTEIGANAEMETLKFQILEVNDQFFVGLNYF